MAISLFDKVGGFAKVSRVVMAFYDLAEELRSDFVVEPKATVELKGFGQVQVCRLVAG